IAKGYHAVAQIEVKSAAMLWSEREARRNEKNAAEQAENQVPTASQPQQTKGTAPSSRPEMETQQGETENFARQPPAPKSEQIKATPIQSQPLQAERQRCQEALDEIMRTGTISFPAGSDKFNSDSLATLQRLTDIRDLCEGRIVIEIAGHTDSLGSASRNQDLSQRRAQMVRSYLIEQGMSAAQLSTRGYGEERPLVPNTTSDNRARNRRIEFHAIIN
ncbi:MAG: OmpA family protein, partial [Pseudomonadota bacterium]